MKLDFFNFLFGGNQHKFVVAKAYCIPCRGPLYTALEPYGIKIHSLTEMIVRDKAGVPQYEQAEFWVSKNQANWTEYLLFRSKQFVVRSGFVNRVSNERWAAKHDTMPRPWSSKGGVWVEKSCKSEALRNRR